MPTNTHPALADLRDQSNIEIAETDFGPFSLAEQLSLEGLARGCDVSWFTNYWVPLTWRSPFVATVHDLLHLERDLFPAPLHKRALSHLVFRKLRSSARGIMFVSRFSQRCFFERLGEPPRSAVVPHGVDPRFQVPEGITKERMALVVSALKSHKNLDMLVQAWSQARLLNGWRLVIVHPGDALRSSIWSGGPPDIPGATIIGGISDEELRHLYSRAAIFMFPSKYEGFGLPLIEAAMAGCRILASTAPALVEVARGMTVSHIAPDDVLSWQKAIEMACSDFSVSGNIPEADMNLAAAAQATWPLAAQRIIEFFETL